MVLFLGLLGGLLIWQMQGLGGMEPQYESTAILQVVAPEGASPANQLSHLQREMKAMTSDEVLQPVVEVLGLADKWSLTKEQTVVTLRGRTVVSSLGNQEDRARVAITVRAPDAELTRAIAAEVAGEYQRQGNARAIAEYEKILRALNEEIAEQEKRVEKKRRALDSIRHSTDKRGRERFSANRIEA